MDGLLHPVGPETPAVYWRRRAVVVAGPLVLILVLIWLWPGGSAGSPAAAPGSPSASEAPTAAATAASAAASASSSASTAVPACQDSDLTVTVEPSKPSFPVGSQAVFLMKVQNSSAAPCSRDVGPKNSSFLVTSGGFRVWSSDDCSPGGASQVETIPPNQAFGVQGTWTETITTPGCPSPQDSAQPGTYDVEASNGAVTSQKARFSLDG